ncbi:Fic family protein [Caballeronia humi]|uniref:Filamentation induced by cAMP protein Fic n=1 Tax=Caballeronia humi TaxID=326474 RepID=A0A158FWC4_9BURK|nr:Fic family protein [Caballeronia humi]SAL24156.1 filamentation induced by cAMP protein Fic [Caballeronia humi]
MTDVTSFQPLFPEDRVLGPLIDKASELTTKSRALLAKERGPMATAMTPLLRNMNSYYSNKIEGQHTTPASIEQALKTHYSPDSGERGKQFAAIAHIRAEEALETVWSDLRAEELFDAEKVTAIHRLFFANLPDEYCITSDQKPIIPGAFREEMVKVGNHLAPEADLIPALLNEWGKRYKRVKGSEGQLIATACSHQRLAWVHPFIDGNGRVCRLHSHLTLRALGLTDGLWSPLRGFARTHDEYYARLAAADSRRRNDLDGRGNLSQEELVKFVHYFLDCCLDQVNFMLGMTAFDGVRSRLRDLLIYLDANPWRIGSDKSIVKPDKALLALETVALLRPLSRAEFGQIIGESEATVRRITRSLLDFGVLQSASHKDPLSFALPLKSLRFLFPRLWPEVDTE